MPAPAPRRGRLACRAHKHAIVSRGISLVLLCSAGTACAQFSATASIVSDYRYRGVSLSDNEPAGQVGVNYDSQQGVYAGAFVSTVEQATYETHGVQAIAFAGYAWRLPSGLSLEAGADYTVVTAAPRFDYPEVYAGFAFQNLSGRLYYSLRYFGQDSPAVYAELDLAQPLRDNVYLLAHVGFLASNAKSPYPGPYGHTTSSTVDGAVGIGLTWEGFSLQLSWVGINQASPAYGVAGSVNRNGVVASLSRAF